MSTFPPVRRAPGRGGGAGGGGWAPTLTPRIAVRIAVLGGIAMALLGVLLVRLWFLQIISTEQYAERAEGNRLRTIVDEAPRGNVVDRDGEPLVTNRPGKNVVALPRELTGARREQVLGRLSRKLGVPERELIKKVEAGENRPFEEVVLASNIDPPLYRYLAERRRQFPGIGLEDTWVRTYPEGALAAQVVGSTGKIAPDQIDDYRRRGYAGDETVGQEGLEAEYERILRGTPGERVVEVDATGEPRGRELVSSRSPEPGRDLQLAIDLDTQRALEEGLASQVALNGLAEGAAGVALDPSTGEVLAIASYPDYDPAAFVRGRTREIREIYGNPLNPVLNRAVGGRYPAGSTFKVVTALAALERGVLQPGEVLDSPSTIEIYGQDFSNFEQRSHGTVGLETALEVSSDTFFYQLGKDFYEAQGSPLQEEAARFGLGEPTGIDLPGEQAGLLPTPAWKRRNFAGPAFSDLDRSWKPGDSVQLAVGQGYFLATPLQMASVYAAIANGGTVHTPSVARRVLDPNGRVVQELSRGRPSHELDVSPQYLDMVRQGLYQAANGPNGTATAVFGGVPAEYRVAGKTGTAEPGDGSEDHSWFVGYAPYDDPQIVVAAVIEHGGTGANAAAPVVCGTMAAFFSYDPALCGTGALAN